MAQQHHRTSTLRRYGFNPWLRLLTTGQMHRAQADAQIAAARLALAWRTWQSSYREDLSRLGIRLIN
jgi:hypothetical protein